MFTLIFQPQQLLPPAGAGRKDFAKVSEEAAERKKKLKKAEKEADDLIFNSADCLFAVLFYDHFLKQI